MGVARMDIAGGDVVRPFSLQSLFEASAAHGQLSSKAVNASEQAAMSDQMQQGSATEQVEGFEIALGSTRYDNPLNLVMEGRFSQALKVLEDMRLQVNSVGDNALDNYFSSLLNDISVQVRGGSPALADDSFTALSQFVLQELGEPLDLTVTETQQQMNRRYPAGPANHSILNAVA